MSRYPTEINNFHQTLSSLSGIGNVCSGIDPLDDIKAGDLSLSEYAHLPIATLLRTDGGLADELLLQFEFTIDNTHESLLSLEFLSWFVRDQSRSGAKIQLRTFALPPETPNGRQLGQTLKFHIDYFFKEATDSLAPVLEKVAKLDESLKLFIDLYNIPTRNQQIS